MRKVKRKKGNKKLVLLMVLVLLVGIGFAALQSNLRINGNATIESYFSVGITDIVKADSTGGAFEQKAPTFTSKTASFDVGLKLPGDTVVYNVTVQNDGEFNAKLDSLLLDQNGNSNIKYEVLGIEEGHLLTSFSSHTFQVKVSYVESDTVNEAAYKEATISMSFVQTNENASEQETKISEFEKTTSEGLKYYTYVSSSTDDSVTAYAACGDSPELPGFNMNLYDENGNLLVERTCSNPFIIQKNHLTTLKTRDTISVNGKIYMSEFSEDEKMLLVGTENGELLNVADNENELISMLTDFEGTSYIIPGNVKVKVGAFVGSNIEKIILLPAFPLSNLGHETLINYKGSTNVLKTIVNQTGQSIDWAPIIGVYGKTCEFVTGTCGDVTITDVE